MESTLNAKQQVNLCLSLLQGALPKGMTVEIKHGTIIQYTVRYMNDGRRTTVGTFNNYGDAINAYIESKIKDIRKLMPPDWRDIEATLAAAASDLHIESLKASKSERINSDKETLTESMSYEQAKMILDYAPPHELSENSSYFDTESQTTVPRVHVKRFLKELYAD